MRLGRRRSSGAREHQQAGRERPEQRLQACDGVLAIFQVLAEPDERGDGRERNRTEQCIEGETVCATCIGERRDEDK